MPKNYSSNPKTSFFQKIALMVLSALFLLIVLEISLRLGHLVFVSVQEYRNILSIKQKGAYRILCLGESTTAGQYPRFLEQVLNQSDMGIHFSVIDKGIVGTNTTTIVSQLEEILNKYQPNMVITMMGYNDRYMMYYKDMPEVNPELFQHWRTYRFIQLIHMHILKKLNKEDIYGLDGETKPRKTKSLDKKIISSAKKSFQKRGLRFDPKDDKGYVEMGDYYQSQGRLYEAERLFKEATRLNSKNSNGYSKLGWTCQVQGKLPEAEELFLKAIELNPSNDEAHVGLGRLYQAQGKFSEAEAEFKKAIELNPRNCWAYLGLGEAYRSLNQPSQAEELFKKILELTPRIYEEYLGVGVGIGGFYPVQGSRLADEAEALFKRAIELHPKSEWLYVGLGDIYRSQGKLSKAEALLKEALLISPKNDRIYVILGDVYRSQGKSLPTAEALFKEALALNPKNDWAYVSLGRLYQMQRQLSKAESAFKEALALNPKNDRAYLGLGEIYRLQGRLSEAESAFKEAVELNPKNSWGCRALESLYRETDRMELAEEYNKKSVELNLKEYSYSQIAIDNYHKVKNMLDKRGIRLVCMQYPMRNIEPLKNIFNGERGVIFVDNEWLFKEVIRQEGYREYFRDMFGGDFGHCTSKGNRLLAENIANSILKKEFGK